MLLAAGGKTCAAVVQGSYLRRKGVELIVILARSAGDGSVPPWHKAGQVVGAPLQEHQHTDCPAFIPSAQMQLATRAHACA